MKEVSVTPEIITLAENRNRIFFAKYGNGGTYRTDKSRQRLTGYLAEAAIQTAFERFRWSDNDEYDFSFMGSRFDSKAQGCNLKPMPNYAATLYADQASRKVDYLIFSRVKNDFSMVWIAGLISKEEYLQKSRLVPAGVDNGNFIYDQPRYELRYAYMTDCEEFLRSHEPMRIQLALQIK